MNNTEEETPIFESKLLEGIMSSNDIIQIMTTTAAFIKGDSDDIVATAFDSGRYAVAVWFVLV